MALLYIAIGVLLCVLIYLALIYYFLFYKEKPLKERPGMHNISSTDPEFYFPTKQKNAATGKTVAVAGLFIVPTRRHKNDKNENSNDKHEKSEIHRREAFPDRRNEDAIENFNFTDLGVNKSEDASCAHRAKEDRSLQFEDSYHAKEEKSVHFADEPRSHSSGYEGSTYQRSEEVDHGYGTLSGDNDTGHVSYYND